MSDPRIAIVLGHGEIANGLVSAVERITGIHDRFIALSNEGLGTSEIEALLRERMEESGARVVFTDLPAGSCNFAACKLLRGRPDIVVVTGVNLPALLHFATSGDAPAGDGGESAAYRIAEEAAERGAAAMRLLRGKPRDD
jgi:mannose/fructose-specific phosphotransferase system component IIA